MRASALPKLAAKARMLEMYENATLLTGSLRAQEYRPTSDPRGHLDAPSALAGTPHIAELRRGRSAEVALHFHYFHRSGDAVSLDKCEMGLLFIISIGGLPVETPSIATWRLTCPGLV